MCNGFGVLATCLHDLIHVRIQSCLFLTSTVVPSNMLMEMGAKSAFGLMVRIGK